MGTVIINVEVEDGLFELEGPELLGLQVVLYHGDAESVKLQLVTNQKAVAIQFKEEPKRFSGATALHHLIVGLTALRFLPL
jgi:hypothetical protein